MDSIEITEILNMTSESTDEPIFNRNDDEMMNNDSEELLNGRIIFNNTEDLHLFSKSLRNHYDNFDQPNYTLIGMYLPTMVISLIANILVIAVVLRNRYMRSVTNYLVVNLSVSDLFVTILCMPMGITQAITITWMYGKTMCKLFYYLQGVSVAASVFTITAMSIDRYSAITSPITFRRVFNRKITIIVIMSIWFASLVLFSPVFIAVTLKSYAWNNITMGVGRNGTVEIMEVFVPPVLHFCSEEFDTLGIPAHIFGMGCFVIVYAIPGLVVVVTYSMMGHTLCSKKPPFDYDSARESASSQQGFRLVRERKRVAWILLVMAILFALCWLPYNVLRLLLDFDLITLKNNGKIIGDVLSYFLYLGHANSALNPVVYCFMTRNFRRNICDLLCRNRNGRRKLESVCMVADSSGRSRRLCNKQGDRAAPNIIDQAAPRWYQPGINEYPNNDDDEHRMSQLLQQAQSSSALLPGKIHDANEVLSTLKCCKNVVEMMRRYDQGRTDQLSRSHSHPEFQCALNYDDAASLQEITYYSE